MAVRHDRPWTAGSGLPSRRSWSLGGQLRLVKGGMSGSPQRPGSRSAPTSLCGDIVRGAPFGACREAIFGLTSRGHRWPLQKIAIMCISNIWLNKLRSTMKFTETVVTACDLNLRHIRRSILLNKLSWWDTWIPCWTQDKENQFIHWVQCLSCKVNMSVFLLA